MGSWGAGAFDNDSAADWAADLGDGGTDAVTLALSDLDLRPADLASIIEQPAPRKVFCMVELVLDDPSSGRRLGEFPIPPGVDVYLLFSQGALDPVTGRSRRVAVDVETGETLWDRDTAGLERLSVMMPGYLIAILVR